MCEENLVQQYKCNKCKWLINTYCENFAEHSCFTSYDENVHQFVVDNDLYIYMVPKILEYTDEAVNIVEDDNNNEAQESVVCNNSLGNLRWTHEAILCLINLYKKNIQNFNSTKEKNDVVWNKVSLAMRASGFQYTSLQCKFKFKYLKSKYIQKKDNMKSSSSGQAAIKFQYFNEMDDIFGKKPNVEPPSLASNLTKRKLPIPEDEVQVLEEDNAQHPSTSTEPIKKQKKGTGRSTLDMIVTSIKEEGKIREEKRQQRHAENMEYKYQLMNAFNTKMDALIDSLKKN